MSKVVDLLTKIKNEFFREVIEEEKSPTKKSAVLLLFKEKDDELYLLFTKRTQAVSEHKGEISFPGGNYKEEDKRLEETALREAEEELGIDKESIEIIGRLNPEKTAITNYLIYPFIGYLKKNQEYKPNQFELEKIIEIPLTTLLNMKPEQEEDLVWDNQRFKMFFYYFADETIWGATARILTQFLERLTGKPF